jgi:hypothetical protein
LLRCDRNGWLLAGVLVLGLWACGDDGGGGGDGVDIRDKDAGEDGGEDAGRFDASDVPFPTGPRIDGSVEPGDPPEELMGQQCAVDTNKLFDLVESDLLPAPTQLAVDPVDSHFGLSFAGLSEECVDALYFAELQGPSGVGKPEISTVVDECTAISGSAIAHSGESWLLASVDNRMDTVDLWVQPYDGEKVGEAQRLSENPAREREVALARVSQDSMLAVWTDEDLDSGINRLLARPLAASGEPSRDVVVLEESDSSTFAGLSVARIGAGFAALAYRRSDGDAASIVLDILSASSGERDRDSWVLTESAGAYGGVDLATDERGGAVLYSLVQGESRQLWLQLLGNDGRAARVMSGNQVGGPSQPQRIVGPPSNAIDGSIARLAIGYAVAARALPGGAIDSPRIRVTFLESSGRVTGGSDVALASEFGGRTAIEAAIDGRVVLGWSDVLEDGTTALTAVKLPCVGGL